MQTTHVEITEATFQKLSKLSASSGESIQAILDEAVEDYRRKLFLQQANAMYEALYSHPITLREKGKKDFACEGLPKFAPIPD